MSVHGAAFGISWELPTEGRIGELLTMRLCVRNNTMEMRAMRLTFSENDAFLFSGLKLYHFRLPPSFTQNLCFNLLPIRTGAVHLPMPKLQCVTTGTEVLDTQAKELAYIRPSEPRNSAWADQTDSTVRQVA